MSHLAFHLLGRAARQLPADFQVRYGYRPLLLETFVEEGRFAGTCYRAASWVNVGRTSGRRRNGTRPRVQVREEKPRFPIKSIWLDPLPDSSASNSTCPAPKPSGSAYNEPKISRWPSSPIAVHLILIMGNDVFFTQKENPEACDRPLFTWLGRLTGLYDIPPRRIADGWITID